MYRYCVLFSLVMGGLIQADQASQPLLNIQYLDNIEVPSGHIYFRDIALVAGEGEEVQKLKNTKVGNAANFGLTRYLSTFTLYARYLVPLESKYRIQGHVDKRIKITTRAGRFPRDSLIGRIDRFLKVNPVGSRGDYEFELLSAPRNIHVPVGEYRIAVRATDAFNRSGRQALELVIEGTNRVKRTVPVSIFIRNFDSVWVTRRRVPRDSRITQGMLKKEYRDITRLSGVPVRSLRELEGKKARQTIIGGRIVTNKLITLEPLVKQGQEVKVFAHRNGILLTLDGIARQDGCLGQIIRVKNLVSHKLVRARVLEKGRLELVSLAARGRGG